jgi:hypothetical protein
MHQPMASGFARRSACVAAACFAAATSAGCAGCGATCSQSDLSCLLEHLTVQIGMNVIALVDIPAGAVSPSQMLSTTPPPVVLLPSTPAVTLPFQGASDPIGLPLQFTDPNGRRIGGCFTIHPYKQPGGDFGTSQMRGFPSVDDGLDGGLLPILFTSGVDPAGSQIQYVLDLYPITCPRKGQEALATLLDGGAVPVGSPLSMVVTVGAPSGGSCSGSQQLASCPDGTQICCSTNQVCCHDSANGGAIGCEFSGFCQ